MGDLITFFLGPASSEASAAAALDEEDLEALEDLEVLEDLEDVAEEEADSEALSPSFKGS